MADTRTLVTHKWGPDRQRLARDGAPSDTLTPEESRENVKAIDAFLKQVGGRESLLDTLSVAADAPEVEKVVSLLLDPRYDTWTLRRVCALANLTVVDLFAAYKKAMVVQAHLVAYHRITQQILPVVDDVMQRAAPYKVGCPDCGATGRKLDDKGVDVGDCPACAGQKQVTVLPDLDRQKLALELGQLIQKSAGLNIQQNTVNLPTGGDPRGAPSTLVEVQHAVRALLRGPRTPIVDVDPVPPPAADAGVAGAVEEAHARS